MISRTVATYYDKRAFAGIVGLYPLKGRCVLLYPTFVGDIYRFNFHADNAYWNWTVKGPTIESVLAKAMVQLTRSKP